MARRQKGTAPEKLMAELHMKLAEVMLTELKREGGVTPAFLAVVAKFLKDNGIEADPDNSPNLAAISASLPSLEEMEDEAFLSQ